MTVAAFAGYAVDAAGAGIWLAMLTGAATGAVMSVLIARAVFEPFLRRGTSRFAMVMVSLAVAVILQNAIQAVAGTGFRSYAGGQGASVHLLGMVLTSYRLVIIAVAALSMLALHGLLRYTRTGKALRATAADPELARSSGIATERVTTAAWALSGALCGLGGVALAVDLATFDFTFGNSFLLIIVAAAVFGSVGEPYGAMVGAVVIGMASEFAAIWAPALKQVIAFVILVVILLVRPNGLWRRSFAGMDVAAR